MSKPVTEEQIRLALPTPAKIFTRGVIGLLALLIVGFILTNYASDFSAKHLALHPRDVVHGRVWQLVTYWLINPNSWILLFAMTVLLFMASAVEREWGTRSFLGLWLTAVVGCGVIWTVVMLVLGKEYVGAQSDAGSYAVIAAFGLLFRRKRFFYILWTIEAQVIALLLIGVGVILSIPNPLFLIWVLGAGLGWLYVKVLWRQQHGRPHWPAPRKVVQGPFIEIDDTDE